MPMWEAALREGAGEEAGGLGGPAAPASVLRDMAAPNPFPPALWAEHVAAVQVGLRG